METLLGWAELIILLIALGLWAIGNEMSEPLNPLSEKDLKEKEESPLMFSG